VRARACACKYSDAKNDSLMRMLHKRKNRQKKNWISERNAESTSNSRPTCIYPSPKYTQWVS